MINPAKTTGSMISPLSGFSDFRSNFRNELISETSLTIFLKLGIKLGDNKGEKIARPIFYKNSHFGRFWPNVPKNGQITVFGTLLKNDSKNFYKIALKVSTEIVLQDRIVILP